jgi:hypothetical protein
VNMCEAEDCNHAVTAQSSADLTMSAFDRFC